MSGVFNILCANVSVPLGPKSLYCPVKASQVGNGWFAYTPLLHRIREGWAKEGGTLFQVG